jgi:hypothetical protein
LRALEAAETDTEKFATLFLVPKLVRGSDCDRTARLYLMKVRSSFDSRRAHPGLPQIFLGATYQNGENTP